MYNLLQDKRARLLLLAAIIAIILLLLFVVLFSGKKNAEIQPGKKSPTGKISENISPQPTVKIYTATPTPTPQPIKISGYEIASKTRKFIESLKTSPGDYTTSLSCLSGPGASGSCQSTGVTSYIPGMVVSMYEDFYNQTKNPQDKESADKIMDELMVKCQSSTSFCEMIFFPLFSRYQSTKESKYLTAMKRVGDEIFLPETAEQEKQENINVFSLRTKKLLMIYSSTKDEKYLAKAKDRLQELAEVAQKDTNNFLVFKENNNAFRKYDCQMHWTVDYQFYKSTNDKKYLDQMISFVDQLNLDKNFDKINDIVPLATCGESLISLYQETANQKYLDTSKLILRFTVKNFWDGNMSPKFNGDNGFLFNSFKSTDGNLTNTKTLTENIWITRNIIKTAWDEQFEL